MTESCRISCKKQLLPVSFEPKQMTYLKATFLFLFNVPKPPAASILPSYKTSQFISCTIFSSNNFCSSASFFSRCAISSFNFSRALRISSSTSTPFLRLSSDMAYCQSMITCHFSEFRQNGAIKSKNNKNHKNLPGRFLDSPCLVN